MPLAAEWIYRRTRMAKKKKRKAEPGDVATNRQAAFRYHLLERWVHPAPGLGGQVAARRRGAAQGRLRGDPRRRGVAPEHAHRPLQASLFREPRPGAAAQAHRREIERLIGKTAEKGLTLVPTRVYFKGSRAKVELALAKGKERHDKRRAIKDRETRREIDRALSDRR